MSVTDDAIAKIKAMIISGDLEPGSRLPREADLAAELGVSRNSLREAVRALSLVRILDVRQGDGTYVSSLEPKSLLDAMSFLLEFHQDDSVLDILGVRRILEPAATALAAQSMSEDQIEHLRTLVVPEHSSVTDLVALDLEFHAAIAAASGNKVLASLLESLSMPTMRARIWRGITEEGAFERTVAEHRGICDAIAAHDPELAHARALAHVAGVMEWLRRAAP
ncbi:MULTISPECIES: FadR/GntR family transcriptional regulator [Nocardia]|uniref:GntR family transcriptional regulator n=1 Tax=Nocardia vulneris TaxID=1141657 RepID=A0ABR4ZB96_9NOCA|nr:MULTISPECIES: FadR/GntR family transcriptional regulator [Nocardia]ASF07965.1 FadR family transcriptional regulator [Nocardia brasiliensis]KIA62628.1 GntR family transcriptional regulator [Nocardia vulneris]MBF6542529.1 FadR family transcriptional regulator [Nocardia brasiliensis]SUB54416.1 L-lactate utilization operon repressor [Nocardia brasiliensis]GAJ84730.1 putative transcriptional regulator [Nocardia brasiliensis NBRC 14402]